MHTQKRKHSYRRTESIPRGLPASFSIVRGRRFLKTTVEGDVYESNKEDFLSKDV
jgi:hypothetical protein